MPAHRRTLARPTALAVLAAGLAASLPARADAVDEATGLFRNLEAELRVAGMTFVGSRGDQSEFVLRAERAFFQPDTSLARLEEVHVTSSDPDEANQFEVSCARGELNVETNDFLADGDVEGTTADGRSYSAPWVRYDHEQALLYTDAPVVMQDESGTFRGDGFRYFVNERRFRLLGNVSLVAAP